MLAYMTIDGLMSRIEKLWNSPDDYEKIWDRPVIRNTEVHVGDSITCKGEWKGAHYDVSLLWRDPGKDNNYSGPHFHPEDESMWSILREGRRVDELPLGLACALLSDVAAYFAAHHSYNG